MFYMSTFQCIKGVFKYPDYDNDYKNSNHSVISANKSILVKNSNRSIDLKNTSWDYKNRLVDPRINGGHSSWRNPWSWYPKPSQDVFLRSMDQFNFFHKKWTCLPSGLHGGYFYSQYNNPDTWKPINAFWSRLGKLEFFRKIVMWNINDTSEVILMLKFVIREFESLLGKVEHLYEFWKTKWKILSTFPSNTENFECSYIEIPTEQVSSVVSLKSRIRRRKPVW